MLVAVAVLPLLAVASVLIWREGVDQRRATEESLQSSAQVFSVAIDRQLLSYRRVLDALAASDMIDRKDFASMHAYARRVAEVKGAEFISLFDASGRQIFNTSRSFGEGLPDPFRDARPRADGPPVGDASALKRALATGRPTNSDLFYALATGRLMFTIDIPVKRDGKVAYAMNIGFRPDRISELLMVDEDLRQVRAVVVDSRGFVVGRWRDGSKFAGERVSPEMLVPLARGEQGSKFSRADDGTYVFRSFVRSSQTGWSTIVTVDAEEIRRQENTVWIIWGSAALAALLLSLALTTWLARRLDDSFTTLAQAAADDNPPADYGLPSRELDRLRDALIAARESRESAQRLREDALREEARRVVAEAANQDKDRFMAAVVHELRTPLAALNNVATLLKAGQSDERVVGILQRQVRQLARLVDDLMETSRLQFGKFHLERSRIDLRDVARQAVEATTMRHRDKRQQIRVEVPEQPVTVDGDFTRLNQVIANLLDNAMKFTPPGGEVEVRLHVEVGHAVLTVVDSGQGIEPQYLSRIFERFSQASGMAAAGEGLGLGLAVARDLVEAHAGRIEVASEGAGRGTRFTVVLPLAEPAA